MNYKEFLFKRFSIVFLAASIAYYYFNFNLIYYLLLLIGISFAIRNFELKKDIIIASIILFCIYITINLIFYEKSIDTIRSYIKLLIVITPFFIFEYFNNFKNKKINSKFTVIFAFIINICGFYEQYSKLSIFKSYLRSTDMANWQLVFEKTQAFRPFTIFGHPIIFGIFLLCLFWILLYLDINNIQKFILICMTLTNIYYTKSRSIWISLVITIFLLVIRKCTIKKTNTKFNLKLFYKKNMINFFIISLSMIIVIIFSDKIMLIFNSIYLRFSELYNGVGDVSRTQRIGTIDFVKNAITNNVFNFFVGHGPSSLSRLLESVTIELSNFITSDNQYLTIVYDFGVLGLIIFIIPLLTIIRKFFAVNLLNKYKGINLAIISIYISMFFFEAFNWPSVMAILFFLLTYEKKLYDISDNRG